MTVKVTNTYNLKLTPSQFGQNSMVVNCSQYDSLYRVIQFNLYNGNAIYSIPEGSVVTIRGTKKDLTGFEYECDFYNNIVTFPIRGQITIYPGKVPAELRIVNDGEIIGSWNFVFLVEESPLSNDTIISETQLPLLESALQAAAEAENYKNLAQQSADNASESEQNASESEANALTYSQNAQTSANSASQSEANALTYSQNASESASEAQGFAQEASESATEAQGYATQAEQSAQRAETAAEGIEGYVDDARGYAEQSATSASNASQYASNASQSATNASQSASSAQTYASNANQSAQNASSSATSAQTYAGNASTSATQSASSATQSAQSATYAQTYANNASASAVQAQGYATNASDSATASAQSASDSATSAQNAEASATEAQEAVETIDEAIKNKADIDGVYPKLIAGGIVETETKDEVFAYKVSEHTGIANLNSIKGNTLVFNQLVQNGNFADISSWNAVSGTTYTVSNNEGHILSSASGAIFFSQNIAIPQNHVILMTAFIKASKNVGSYFTAGSAENFAFFSLTTGWQECSVIARKTSTNQAINFVRISSGLEAGDSVDIKNAMIVDLTQMFGAGNEPTSVAEFTKLFPLSYYSYNVGSLLSFNGTGIKTTNEDTSVEETLSLPIATYFPNGMKSAGSVYDELTPNKATTRVGTRAYQSGDESDSTLTTDGTNTNYPLATPTEVDVDLGLSYRTYEGGTEQLLPVNTDVPVTSPLSANVEFDFDENINARITKILSMIAPVETLQVSRAYSVGQYLIYDYTLYKVTSAIASGGTITIGTNVTATTLAEILENL